MHRLPLLLLGLLAAHACAHAASYKWQDADGRVHYGDRPPNSSARLIEDPASAAPPPAVQGDPQLPYPLRSAAARYPVVLYTSADCDACAAGRSHLAKRGVPFSERSLRSPADIEAFKRLGFPAPAVPALSVGREKASGFEAVGWDQLLDAAGYPKTSMLPKGYRPGGAEPLVAEQPAPERAAPGPATDTASAEERPPATPEPARRLPPQVTPAATTVPTTSIRF